MMLLTATIVSAGCLATILFAAGMLLNSFSRYDRGYRIGPLRYRKIIVDGEPTYCFQILATYRQQVTRHAPSSTSIATTN